MKTEAEIKSAGMQALIATFGLVKTERFLAAVSRDKFDYTQWRRTDLPEMNLRSLARGANNVMRQQRTNKAREPSYPSRDRRRRERDGPYQRERLELSA